MDNPFNALCSGGAIKFRKGKFREAAECLSGRKVGDARGSTPSSSSAALDFFGSHKGKEVAVHGDRSAGAAATRKRKRVRGHMEGNVNSSLSAPQRKEEAKDRVSGREKDLTGNVDATWASEDDGDSHSEEDGRDEGEEDVQLFPGSQVVRGKRGDAGKGGESQVHREEIACFRRRIGIKVSGVDVADPIDSFESLAVPSSCANFKRVLLANIEESLWKEPTPAQMQAIPVMLEGRDIIAAAPTGSGKTAAFVIPVLTRLLAGREQNSPDGKAAKAIRAVLLAPTRELCAQINSEVQRLANGKKVKSCLLSKTNAATAIASPGQAVLGSYDLIVSTPMRLVSVIRAGAITLTHVEVVVLDEADKLFDTGRADKPTDTSFLTQVDEVLAACGGPQCQRALFSATVGEQVQDLATSVLRDPVHITIGTSNAGASTIDQKLTFVGSEEGKLLAVRQLVQEGLKPPVLVFLQSKERAKELFHELVYDGINADVITADRTQEQRDAIIARFRTGDIWVLICTDLMARGIDFKGVKMVINYDFPQSSVSYIHRIGRTGRAGRRGTAITFFTEDDMDALRSIANVMRLSGCEVPAWMLSMKKRSSKDKKRQEVSAPRRAAIATVSKYDRNTARQVKKRKQTEKKQATGSQGLRRSKAAAEGTGASAGGQSHT